jgi:hypothetical protein
MRQVPYSVRLFICMHSIEEPSETITNLTEANLNEADVHEMDLTRLWKIEEKKELPESDHLSRKHPTTESKTNLRGYFIATTCHLVFCYFRVWLFSREL